MELREAIEAFKARKISWWELDPDIITIILNAVEVGTLIPTDAVFQVKDGYEVTARHRYSDTYVMPETALTIRSADDVRREAEQWLWEYMGTKMHGLYVKGNMTKALTVTPQPKGGDDE